MDAIRTDSRRSSPTSSQCKGKSRTRSAVALAALLAVACLLVGGCAVGPNYHPPKEDSPPAFANGVQTNLAPDPIAITWWRGFNDELLNQLVSQALLTNHDLRIATARLREARAFYGGAVADFFPVAEATASYNKSVSSKDSVPFPLTREQRELQLFSAGFDATWELDIFG